MSFVHLLFLAGVLVAANAVAAEDGSDQVLCAIETDRPIPEPRPFKVLELDKDGNGNSKAVITSSSIVEKTQLRVRLDARGEATDVVIAGAVIPLTKLISPGVSLQVSERHLKKDWTRDLIRIVATKTATGYDLRVNTLKSGGVFSNPTFAEFWTVAKDKAGTWGIVYAPTASRKRAPAAVEDPGNVTFANAIRLTLTLKDNKDPSQGFNGITEYTMSPAEKKASAVIAGSTDPRVIDSRDKLQPGAITVGEAAAQLQQEPVVAPVP